MSKKVSGLLLMLLFAITAIIVVLFYLNVVPLPSQQAQEEHSITSIFLNWGIILFAVCALVSLAFPILEFVKGLLSNPKSAVKTLIIIAAIFLICIVGYSIASGSIDSITETLVENDEPTRKWSGAGLNVLYITLGISILAVIYAEVAKKIN